MRDIAILRPEPGASATLARIEAAGLTGVRIPLFAVRAVPWDLPDPGDFDCLLLTSANAVRHAGAALADLRALPVLAVGSATADAARAAGLEVAVTGTHGVAALGEWAHAMDFSRALHLAGRDRVEPLTLVAATRIVYVNDFAPPPPEALARLRGSVALVHSPRGGEALRTAAEALRTTIRVAAISQAALDAAGTGWEEAAVAALPNDDALIDTARALAIDRARAGEDKAP